MAETVVASDGTNNKTWTCLVVFTTAVFFNDDPSWSLFYGTGWSHQPEKETMTRNIQGHSRCRGTQMHLKRRRQHHQNQKRHQGLTACNISAGQDDVFVCVWLFLYVFVCECWLCNVRASLCIRKWMGEGWDDLCYLDVLFALFVRCASLRLTPFASSSLRTLCAILSCCTSPMSL